VYRVELLTADSPGVERLAGNAMGADQLRRALSSVGGMFQVVPECIMPPNASRHWDLSAPDDVRAFMGDALAVPRADDQAIVRFIQKWGILDVAGANIPSSAKPERPWEISAVFPFDDTLHDARDVLKQAQGIGGQLRQLKRTPAREADWRAVAEQLEPWLSSVHPTIRWDRDEGPLPAWTVGRPVELLFVTLWDWATQGGQMRRCRRCDAWFVRRDPRKIFCTTACTNRASAAASYERRRHAMARKGRKP
jgi:hypothetical protein